MALLFKEKPVLADGSDAMEEIEVPKMDTAILMSLLDESHCEDNDCFEWTEMETVPSSPRDDMNWYLEDHVEGISMDEFVQFGNDFDFNCYEIPFENGCASSLWQEIYDTAIYN
ncbi:hypothetical protein CXB51_002164 [Gossypium anomalum]|uniref:Uncharacterized protein n=1 Tax=Gossypium anomalum TaxID=47600 RepID=A0A8J6DED5_9ROSI|nr:hypothetical protein CXB51_002164 [Gossypium anomalum]